MCGSTSAAVTSDPAASIVSRTPPAASDGSTKTPSRIARSHVSDERGSRALRISRSTGPGMPTPFSVAFAPAIGGRSGGSLFAPELRLSLFQERPHPLGEVGAAIHPLNLGGDPGGGVL